MGPIFSKWLKSAFVYIHDHLMTTLKIVKSKNSAADCPIFMLLKLVCMTVIGGSLPGDGLVIKTKNEWWYRRPSFLFRPLFHGCSSTS